jgi:hypothetical protein
MIGTYEAAPGALMNDPYPGFCEPELHAKGLGGEKPWFVRDKVVGAERRGDDPGSGAGGAGAVIRAAGVVRRVCRGGPRAE